MSGGVPGRPRPPQGGAQLAALPPQTSHPSTAQPPPDIHSGPPFVGETPAPTQQSGSEAPPPTAPRCSLGAPAATPFLPPLHCACAPRPHTGYYYWSRACCPLSSPPGEAGIGEARSAPRPAHLPAVPASPTRWGCTCMPGHSPPQATQPPLSGTTDIHSPCLSRLPGVRPTGQWTHPEGDGPGAGALEGAAVRGLEGRERVRLLLPAGNVHLDGQDRGVSHGGLGTSGPAGRDGGHGSTVPRHQAEFPRGTSGRVRGFPESTGVLNSRP